MLSHPGRFTRATAFAALAAFATVAGGSRAHGAADLDLVIRHVNVVDVTGGPTRYDQRIEITGDRITAISSDSADPPAARENVDAAGAFVIPALWDMHTHVLDYPGLAPAEAADATFPLYLAYGVLGIRDMGTTDLPALAQLKHDIASGRRVGPALVITGRPLDGDPVSIAMAQPVRDERQALAAVRSLKDDSADFVSVVGALPALLYRVAADESRRRQLPLVGDLPNGVDARAAASAGQRSIERLSSPDLRGRLYGYLPEGARPAPDDDPAETATILRALQAVVRGAPVAADWDRDSWSWMSSKGGRAYFQSIQATLGRVNVLTLLRRRAIDGGHDVAVLVRHDHGERTYRVAVDAAARLRWLPDQPDELLAGPLRGLAQVLRVGPTWVTPMLTTLRAGAFRTDRVAAPDPRLAYLTQAARAWLSPSEDPRYATWTAMDWQTAAAAYQRDAALVVALHRQGVRLLAGSGGLSEHGLPGFGLHEELGWLVEAGLTPLEALRTATTEPAAYLGREADMGTVEVGKLADLVLVASDPTVDIGNAARVRGVVRAGRFFNPIRESFWGSISR